ncbi:hypothetical protein SLS64_013032 [Diaporthe eres]|uniref:Ankyrin repeat protein n=1 Tax=Diaporthe eres TaxID=83184 RepID=A0ABR1P5Y3_DIAER
MQVRDRIHKIFTEAKEKCDEEGTRTEATSNHSDVLETLEEALNIYDIFAESALRHIALWDSSSEDDLWRAAPEEPDAVAGRNTNHDRPNGRKGVIFDRDIFDRTPLHHAMRTNAPTEPQSLPRCDLEKLKHDLDSKTRELTNNTKGQINWSKASLRTVLDPGTEWAQFMKYASKADLEVLDLDHWTPLHYACHIVLPQLASQKAKQPEKEFHKLQESLRIPYHKRAVLRAKALIRRKVDVNAQGLDGTTPLHCAAASGCVELVELLVKHKANINVKKVDGTTPLHCATMSGCVDLVKFLLRHQAIETTASDGRTLLHMAAMTNKSAMFSWLKTNAEVKDQAGRTPLHLAAMSRAPASITELVDLGAKKDVKDHKGRTPLHLACMYDCPDSVEKLLEVDSAKRPLVYIDPNAKDEQGRTPLHLAALFDSHKAIKTLLKQKDGSSTEAFKYNVDFNTKDMEGRSPLHLAALSNALEALKLLVAHIKDGSGWPPLDEDDQTPFHLAAAEGSTEAIERMGKLMMERDLDPEAKSLLLQSKSDKFTAFSAAAHNGHVSSMKAFLDIHAREGDLRGDVLKKRLLKMQDIDGDTPFWDALRNGLWDVALALKGMVNDDNWDDLRP